jgi:hypothetical protein
MTTETTPLIADWSGRISERCEGSAAVTGEVWLRRHAGAVAGYREPMRWQVLLVLAGDGIPAEVIDLPGAFADPARRDLLLRAAQMAVQGEFAGALGRSVIRVAAHRWRHSLGMRLP